MPLSRLPRMVPLVPQPVAAQEEEGPELPPPKLLTDEQVKAYIQNGFIACVHHPPAPAWLWHPPAPSVDIDWFRSVLGQEALY